LKVDMPVSASLVDQDHSALPEVSASRSTRSALMDITVDLGQPLAATAVAHAREQLILGGAAGNTCLLLNAPRPSVLRSCQR
jgi:hypothetical protein